MPCINIGRENSAIPEAPGVGLTSIVLGLLHACQRKGINVGHFKPISQPSRNVLQRKHQTTISLSENDTSIPFSYVEEKMGDGEQSVILEQVTHGIAVRMAVMSMTLGSQVEQNEAQV